QVGRYGLRGPYATMRRAFGSLLACSGLSGSPAAVLGSIRISVPDRPVGSPVVRTSWLRSAPPSASGGFIAEPTTPGESAHGLLGVPTWPQSATAAEAPSPPVTHNSPSGPKRTSP